MAVLVGTSGWSYDHWVGVLYPRGASSLARLDAYARRFRTVEVTIPSTDGRATRSSSPGGNACRPASW